MVWSGDGYGVAYTGTLRKRFLRLDSGGHPIGPPIDVGPGLVGSLVWTGERNAITGPASPSSVREFWFSQLDAEGEKVGIDVPTVDSGSQGSLSALAWTGTEFGLFWTDVHGAIAMTRLTDFGFPVGDELALSFGNPPVRQPVPLWTGSHFDVI